MFFEPCRLNQHVFCVSLTAYLYISALNNPALGNVKVTECEGLSILYDGLERSLESVRKLRNKVLQKIDLKDDEYLVRGPIILESVDVNQKAIREAE